MASREGKEEKEETGELQVLQVVAAQRKPPREHKQGRERFRTADVSRERGRGVLQPVSLCNFSQG